MNDSRILIVGIDGGTWTVLKPAVQKGYMPHLQEFLCRGTSGILQSTTPPKTPAAWAAFQTGANPGQNGIFDFTYWDKKDKTTHFINADSLLPTLWEIAGGGGKRVGVINVPLTYPPRKINGYMITGILTPSGDSDFTWPAELKTELRKAVPDYHIFRLKNITQNYARHNLELFIKQMAAVVENRARAAQYLMNKEPFDLFMVHFQATDVVQHALWGYLDSNHPLYDPDKHRFILKNFYQPLDEKISRLWRTFQEKSIGRCALLIISDHGFQRHIKRFRLGNWLYEQGFLSIRPPTPKARLASFLEQTLKSFCLHGPAAQGKLGRRFEQICRPAPPSFQWDKTRVFSFSRGNDGFVYLLEPEAHNRKRTESELREKLLQITDPQRQVKVVENIFTRGQIYHGAKLHLMPDLILKPAAGYSFTGDFSPGSRNLFHIVDQQNDFHVGMHHGHGIFMALGADIKAAHTCPNATILDLAPTVLSYLGLAVPGYMDGKVLQDIFSSEISTEYTDAAYPDQAPVAPSAYSDDEQRQIENRLRRLGYLE
ncbi:MAG: hypothetical protein AMJ79_01525 [Phycisphaerae bacterium SM23_30]|nr:MAG: hypothetical protein AMJ79_01525 [Phycisphaerae bacterium SM23_30]